MTSDYNRGLHNQQLICSHLEKETVELLKRGGAKHYQYRRNCVENIWTQVCTFSMGMCSSSVKGSALTKLPLLELSTYAHQRLNMITAAGSPAYTTTTLCQLEDIAGISTRYAIIENLYRQTRGMSLYSDYKIALTQLCCKILSWFDHVFLINPWFDNKMMATCRELWIPIKKSDQVCQNFQTTVEPEGDGSTSNVEIEDVSDETSAISWILHLLQRSLGFMFWKILVPL
jgi:hypothetical protein